MAFSTVNPGPIDRQRQEGEVIEVLLAASQTVKKGNLIIINTVDGLGYVHHAVAAAPIAAAGDMFAGVAMEDVTSAAAGSYYVRCYQTGVFTFTSDAATGAAAYVGNWVFADGSADGAIDQVTGVNDATHGDTPHFAKIGFLVGFTLNTASTAVRVLIRPFHTAAA